MGQGTKVSVIIFSIIIVFFMWGIVQYNRVVAFDEQVNGQWAQVENQLKRRFDLIPNLVETTQGYAKHEKEIFENIANTRTSYFQAKSVPEKVAAANSFESALSRLLMLQENYPNLKANESFLKLMDTLEGTENRIAVERMRYNEMVKILNTYRRTVVGRFISAIAGVEAAEYYQIPEGQQEAPKVKFD